MKYLTSIIRMADPRKAFRQGRRRAGNHSHIHPFVLLLLLPVMMLSFCAVQAESEADRFNSGQMEKEEYFRKVMIMPDMPDLLNISTWLECGKYQIHLISQPVLTPSTTNIKASGEKKFLIIRVGIKNTSDEPVYWLDPGSFHAQEYFLNILGQSYELYTPMSAKVAGSFTLPPFFSPIQPGAELSTVIVFEVCGDVDGWILTFSPYTRDEDGPEDSVSFTLPKVTRQ